jgi:hypothetical protein
MKTGDHPGSVAYDLIRLSSNFQLVMFFRAHILMSFASIDSE